MERPVDLRLHRLKLAKSRALALNPVDLVTVTELNAEIQRIEELGRKPQKLDPVTQAFVDTVIGLNRGRDRWGNPIFKKPPYENLLQ